MESNGTLNKWHITAVGMVIAATALALFVTVCTLSTWTMAIVGPLCLWWVAKGLVLAFSAALSRPGPWPRDYRARYVACLNAAVVGGWIGFAGVPWLALTVLPVYSAVERFVFPRVVPPDSSGVYARLPVWLSLVVLGQLFGYLVGSWTSGAAR
jgi:hypothetical protein